MKDKYNKIKKYLLDLHGISPFYIEVKKLLKENNLEEKF